MAKRAQITNVTINMNADIAFVEYSTGSTKMFHLNKLPKTVTTWLDARDEESTCLNSPKQPIDAVSSQTMTDVDVVDDVFEMTATAVVPKQIDAISSQTIIPHSNQIHGGLLWDLQSVVLMLYYVTLVATASILKPMGRFVTWFETCFMYNLMLDINNDIKPFLADYAKEVAEYIVDKYNKFNVSWKQAWDFRTEICLENRATDEF